jgi:hypothetical protein
MKYDISTFVDDLLEVKNLSDLDEQVLEQMKKDLQKRVENRINAVIATNIPEASREEFEKLIDSDASDEEVSKFCSDKIPNLQDLIATDLVRFRNVYVGS